MDESPSVAEILAVAGEVADLDASLPDLTSRGLPPRRVLNDEELGDPAVSFELMALLAGQFGDRWCAVVPVLPSVEDFRSDATAWPDWAGEEPVILVDVAAGPGAYSAAMMAEPFVLSMVTEVLCMFGGSRSWLLWIHREFAAVLYCRDPLTFETPWEVPVSEVIERVDSLASFGSGDQPWAQAWRDRFPVNFG